MTKKKKKAAFPRRVWRINPATKVKESQKRYSRRRAKREQRRRADEG